MKNIIVFLIVSYFGFVESVFATGISIATIGTDQSCVYNINNTSIQELIDADYDEIRTTNQVEIVENLYINQAVTIVGGYDSCDDANADEVSGRTTIDGNDYYPAITVVESNQPFTVNLHNLKLTNGNGTNLAHGGGLSVSNDGSFASEVRVNNSFIIENRATNGAGVYASGDQVTIYLTDTIVFSNDAEQNGGGIYCNNSTLYIQEGSGVSQNTTYNPSNNYGHGGGLYATNNCNVSVTTGTVGGLFDYRGFVGNQASGHGGGVYLEGGSYFNASSLVTKKPVLFSDNLANSNNNGTGSGGAIYLSGNSTRAFLFGSKVKNNSAANGGGIAAYDSAQFTIGLYHPGSCWNMSQCNEFSNNSTNYSGGNGGALYLNSAWADISHAQIFENNADVATVISAISSSNVTLRQSMIYRNGSGGNDYWTDTYTYRTSGSNLDMLNVTSVYNFPHLANLGMVSAHVDVQRSILYEPLIAQFAHNNNSTSNFKCNNADNLAGISNPSDIIYGYPMFIDTGVDNFHLAPGSPAIDLCSEFVDGILVLTKDIDGDGINWDDPTQMNNLGAVDAGADESYAGDVIFKSTFE